MSEFDTLTEDEIAREEREQHAESLKKQTNINAFASNALRTSGSACWIVIGLYLTHRVAKYSIDTWKNYRSSQYHETVTDAVDNPKTYLAANHAIIATATEESRLQSRIKVENNRAALRDLTTDEQYSSASLHHAWNEVVTSAKAAREKAANPDEAIRARYARSQIKDLQSEIQQQLAGTTSRVIQFETHSKDSETSSVPKLLVVNDLEIAFDRLNQLRNLGEFDSKLSETELTTSRQYLEELIMTSQLKKIARVGVTCDENRGANHEELLKRGSSCYEMSDEVIKRLTSTLVNRTSRTRAPLDQDDTAIMIHELMKLPDKRRSEMIESHTHAAAVEMLSQKFKGASSQEFHDRIAEDFPTIVDELFPDGRPTGVESNTLMLEQQVRQLATHICTAADQPDTLETEAAKIAQRIEDDFIQDFVQTHATELDDTIEHDLVRKSIASSLVRSSDHELTSFATTLLKSEEDLQILEANSSPEAEIRDARQNLDKRFRLSKDAEGTVLRLHEELEKLHLAVKVRNEVFSSSLVSEADVVKGLVPLTSEKLEELTNSPEALQEAVKAITDKTTEILSAEDHEDQAECYLRYTSKDRAPNEEASYRLMSLLAGLDPEKIPDSIIAHPEEMTTSRKSRITTKLRTNLHSVLSDASKATLSSDFGVSCTNNYRNNCVEYVNTVQRCAASVATIHEVNTTHRNGMHRLYDVGSHQAAQFEHLRSIQSGNPANEEIEQLMEKVEDCKRRIFLNGGLSLKDGIKSIDPNADTLQNELKSLNSQLESYSNEEFSAHLLSNCNIEDFKHFMIQMQEVDNRFAEASSSAEAQHGLRNKLNRVFDKASASRYYKNVAKSQQAELETTTVTIGEHEISVRQALMLYAVGNGVQATNRERVVEELAADARQLKNLSAEDREELYSLPVASRDFAQKAISLGVKLRDTKTLKTVHEMYDYGVTQKDINADISGSLHDEQVTKQTRDLLLNAFGSQANFENIKADPMGSLKNLAKNPLGSAQSIKHALKYNYDGVSTSRSCEERALGMRVINSVASGEVGSATAEKAFRMYRNGEKSRGDKTLDKTIAGKLYSTLDDQLKAARHKPKTAAQPQRSR